MAAKWQRGSCCCRSSTAPSRTAGWALAVAVEAAHAAVAGKRLVPGREMANGAAPAGSAPIGRTARLVSLAGRPGTPPKSGVRRAASKGTAGLGLLRAEAKRAWALSWSVGVTAGGRVPLAQAAPDRSWAGAAGSRKGHKPLGGTARGVHTCHRGLGRGLSRLRQGGKPPTALGRGRAATATKARGPAKRVGTTVTWRRRRRVRGPARFPGHDRLPLWTTKGTNSCSRGGSAARGTKREETQRHRRAAEEAGCWRRQPDLDGPTMMTTTMAACSGRVLTRVKTSVVRATMGVKKLTRGPCERRSRSTRGRPGTWSAKACTDLPSRPSVQQEMRRRGGGEKTNLPPRWQSAWIGLRPRCESPRPPLRRRVWNWTPSMRRRTGDEPSSAAGSRKPRGGMTGGGDNLTRYTQKQRVGHLGGYLKRVGVDEPASCDGASVATPCQRSTPFWRRCRKAPPSTRDWRSSWRAWPTPRLRTSRGSKGLRSTTWTMTTPYPTTGGGEQSGGPRGPRRQ